MRSRLVLTSPALLAALITALSLASIRAIPNAGGAIRNHSERAIPASLPSPQLTLAPGGRETPTGKSDHSMTTGPETRGTRFHPVPGAPRVSDPQESAARAGLSPGRASPRVEDVETVETGVAERSSHRAEPPLPSLQDTLADPLELLPKGKRDGNVEPTGTLPPEQKEPEQVTGYGNRVGSSTPAMDPRGGPPLPPVSSGKAIVVDQTAQMLYAYEDGVLIRAMPVSTGVQMYYTPAFSGYVGYYVGTLYSEGLWADNAWYITKARGNIYIHSVPYTFSETGEKIFQGLEFLGVSPSSHGCIRLHPDDAQWLTDWNPEGAFILITPPDFKRQE